MNLKNIFGASVTLCLASAMAVSAETIDNLVSQGTASEKGAAISVEMENRDTGFENVSSTMKMILKTKEGQSISREMRLKIFEIDAEGAGDYSLITFDNPRDVAGTAFLTYSKVLEPDDQWLYLPSLKRVKRISSKNKSAYLVPQNRAYKQYYQNSKIHQ